MSQKRSTIDGGDRFSAAGFSTRADAPESGYHCIAIITRSVYNNCHRLGRNFTITCNTVSRTIVMKSEVPRAFLYSRYDCCSVVCAYVYILSLIYVQYYILREIARYGGTTLKAIVMVKSVCALQTALMLLLLL